MRFDSYAQMRYRIDQSWYIKCILKDAANVSVSARQ